MNTCATCKWWKEDEDSDSGDCHHVANNSIECIQQHNDWFCSNHSAYQRERDRLEIAKAALAGLLADYERDGGTTGGYVNRAVEFADALLSELEKSND